MVRTFFITGAGRGLGLATATAAAARGDVVIATLRDASRGDALRSLAAHHPGRVTIVPLDVADEASCAAVVDHLERRGPDASGGVDVVVHNAGINSQSPELRDARRASAIGALRLDALEHMTRVNAWGALLVTQALRPRLSLSSSIVCVSSRRGSLAGKDRGGNYGYCVSKAALNMVVRGLAHDLAPRVVVAVHPGEVRTAMGQPDATLSPDDAAVALLAFIDQLAPEHSGRFWRTDHTEVPW